MTDDERFNSIFTTVVVAVAIVVAILTWPLVQGLVAVIQGVLALGAVGLR